MNRYGLLVALLALPVTLGAQVRASELGTVAQTIDGTKLTVDYSRPRARGRDTLFGTRAVHWDETWTPGANWATTLELSRNVKLNGLPVPKGKYSVWMVVRKSGDWTVLLDPKSHIYHMEPPDTGLTQLLKIPVHAEAAPFTDVLTWSFPEVRMTGGTLAMSWERVRIPLNIDVEPSLVTTISASDAAPYLGNYSYTEFDSAGKAKATSLLAITHEEGTLRGRWTPDDPYFRKFALIRIAPDWFVPGVYNRKGELYEVLKPEMVVEFKQSGGRAASLVVREEDDHVSGSATRRP